MRNTARKDLLHLDVVKNPGLVRCRYSCRQQAGDGRKHSASDPVDEITCDHPEHDLDQVDNGQAVAENPVESREEVGIERILVEDFGSKPIAPGNILRPGIVRGQIKDQLIEKWRVPAVQ